ncbi:MAG TPA: carboxypeptidase regulatory-like domain-containing protein [Gemmatimonadaceae bacterium]|nr:carboxypeptidase regulatory-like domain-containing protein [Gemmatimonadaceae bacterium]
MPHVGGAQNDARVNGRVVHKATGAPVAGAEVTLAPRNSHLVTDSAGRFRFVDVAPGLVALLVRRVGFAAESASYSVGPREDLDVVIELRQNVQQLDTVSVAARSDPLVPRKLAGYAERKRLGIGRFIDGDILDKEQYRQLGEVITSRTAGSRLVRSKTSSMAWVATTRKSGASLQGAVALDATDRLRGADPRACYPDIYIDGAVVYSFGLGQPLFDINSIGTNTVAAIEFYVGSARVPMQYNKTGAACGVLLIWTK